MGTYVSILKYPSHSHREDFRNKLIDLAKKYGNKAFVYKRFRPKIGGYEIVADLKIRLDYKQQTLIGSPPIYVEIDVPSRVEHLDGAWDVKEKKWVCLYFYDADPDLEDIALAISNGAAGPKAFFEAIMYLKLTRPQKIRVKFARTKEFVNSISRLGSLGWVVMTGIPDRELHTAMFWGNNLQRHEIIKDLIKRGAEIKALVIKNPSKRITIVISDKGSIFSYKNLEPIEAAGELKELIKFFKSSNLFIFE